MADLEYENSILSDMKHFLLATQVPGMIRILLEEEQNVHYALHINACELLDMHASLAEPVFFKPTTTLKVFNDAAEEAMRDVHKDHMLRTHMCHKPFVHVRINKLPKCGELLRDRIPKSKDVGNFLAVEGTVIRTNSVKILEYEKEYQCTRCQNFFTLKSDFELHNVVAFPTRCPVDNSCPSKKFVAAGNSGRKKCKDYQEIKIQEQVRKLSMGTIPRCITIVLEDDLVDCCKAGDDVIVFGCVACRWNSFVAGKFCDVEITIRANNLEVWNEKHTLSAIHNMTSVADEFDCFWAAHINRPMDARNHILASLCPQVYGLYVVKLAVALVLAGGVPRTSSSGSAVRGECHLLLVGDPGTGKSQFLKYVAKITPRSVITTGIGSSAAGLTVSAVRDGPHWSLEAGALVLADGGFCCIDEFSSIKDHDRAAIHEAMEQQTISVAKAGLVCKLSTRTSIVAATNPKLGKYDEYSSVSMNVAIASPLLSRFDVVLVLLDTDNILWDEVVAEYLLSDQAAKQSVSKSKLWTTEQMQGYFGIIRQLKPVLTVEADKVLRTYYRAHRKANSSSTARTTIRLLESLIRLSEAHARLMFRESVTVQDAVAAITVMESSMQGCSLLPTGSILHSCFPNDPMAEFQKHTKLVLQCLNLEHLGNATSSESGAAQENVASQQSASTIISGLLGTQQNGPANKSVLEVLTENRPVDVDQTLEQANEERTNENPFFDTSFNFGSSIASDEPQPSSVLDEVFSLNNFSPNAPVISSTSKPEPNTKPKEIEDRENKENMQNLFVLDDESLLDDNDDFQNSTFGKEFFTSSCNQNSQDTVEKVDKTSVFNMFALDSTSIEDVCQDFDP